jgi:hypothetical protein
MFVVLIYALAYARADVLPEKSTRIARFMRRPQEATPGCVMVRERQGSLKRGQ